MAEPITETLKRVYAEVDWSVGQLEGDGRLFTNTTIASLLKFGFEITGPDGTKITKDTVQ